MKADHMAELANEPPSETRIAPAIVIVALPSVAVWLATHWEGWIWTQAELFAYVAFPAMIPGALMWLWTVATRSTIARYCSALAAVKRDHEVYDCRSCDTGLSIEATSAMVRCSQCGADNVVSDVPIAKGDDALRSSLHTFDDAMERLRRRRATWMLGVALIAVLGVVLLAAARTMVG